MEQFVQTFVPLFVAIDVFGLFPIFISLTETLEPDEKKKVALDASITAWITGIVFVIGGAYILEFLGIRISDFQIAGGILLLILAINDLLSEEKSRRKPTKSLGIVPIGIPLIAGPATLTALITLSSLYPTWIVLVSFSLNILIVFLALWFSHVLVKYLGKGGANAISKIMLILLAAIGVMLIRRGIESVILQMGEGNRAI